MDGGGRRSRDAHAPIPRARPVQPPAAPTQLFATWEVPPSTASKAGYFALGLFLGPLGVVAACLSARSDGAMHRTASFEFSVLGLCAMVIVACVVGIAAFAMAVGAS